MVQHCVADVNLSAEPKPLRSTCRKRRMSVAGASPAAWWVLAESGVEPGMNLWAEPNVNTHMIICNRTNGIQINEHRTIQYASARLCRRILCLADAVVGRLLLVRDGVSELAVPHVAFRWCRIRVFSGNRLHWVQQPTTMSFKKNSDLHSLDFAVNRFCKKLFNTSDKNILVIRFCRTQFDKWTVDETY